MPFEIDETATRLHAIVLTETLNGDIARAEVARAMYELYVVGRINVTFDGDGDPVATMNTEMPVISHPWFTAVPNMGSEPRRIGFQPN